jgi:LuxR family transcriptional regulator, quorum-sensing system regulator BjaR1
MTLDEAIGDIESCASTAELRHAMQRIAENYGFASFNFLDAGRPHVETPFYFGTTGEAWERTYDSNRFVHIDPCVTRVRRTNVPFVWEEAIDLPQPRRGPKSPVKRLMDAAQDFGFAEGLVVPFHFRDRLGRLHSALSVFYWKDDLTKFRFLISGKRRELHLIAIYFIQRCVDLVAVQHRGGQPLVGIPQTNPEFELSARERDVLSWAARGKTVVETADILTISEGTVETHIKRTLEKLGVSNKTHAVAKAITLGIIDV